MKDLRRRKLLRSIGATGAFLAVGGAGTAAANGNGPRQGASGSNTIVDIADGDDRFDTLVSALGATGLAPVLDGKDQYTVFAPTDAAFDDVDTSGLTTEQLRNVLLYHVTRGRRYASSVVSPADIGMLNGDSVSTDGTTLNGGQAEIVVPDIEASNGVVHVIDGVLLP